MGALLLYEVMGAVKEGRVQKESGPWFTFFLKGSKGTLEKKGLANFWRRDEFKRKAGQGLVVDFPTRPRCIIWTVSLPVISILFILYLLTFIFVTPRYFKNKKEGQKEL